MAIDLNQTLINAGGGTIAPKKKAQMFPIQSPAPIGLRPHNGANFRPPTPGPQVAKPPLIYDRNISPELASSLHDPYYFLKSQQNNPADVITLQQALDAGGVSSGQFTPDEMMQAFQGTLTTTGRDSDEFYGGDFYNQVQPDVNLGSATGRGIGNPPTKLIFDADKGFVEPVEYWKGETLHPDDAMKSAEKEEEVKEVVEVVEPVGSISSGASDVLANALGEGIDHKALRTWLLSFTGQGVVVSRLEDKGNGLYEAFEMVEGVESSLGLYDASIDLQDRFAADNNARRIQIEQDRLALDDEMQGEQLRIQEELGRIDQDIARDRIRHEQEIASGNWQNALDVQDRIDERERAGRQLDRDLFNANQELQNRKFELERASFDLDKLEFFQQLSSSPANFADLFNISRGLAPTGAGGPMPQGISRIGQSDVQQTAAQDFRSTGINMAPNINTGALPTLGAEQAVPQFNPAQAQLSFMGGGDPTPVDSSGVPIAPAVPSMAGVGAGDPTDQATSETVVENPTPDQSNNPLQPNYSAPPAYQAPNASNATTDEGLTSFNISAPVTGSNVDGLQALSAPSSEARTAEDVVQGAPLPPGIELAFRNALIGAPQTAQNSIPLLSPQVLNSLTPAEQEVYYGLAQMQGQYLPDLQNLLAARGGSKQIQDSQRVFA